MMASITDCVVEGLKYPFNDLKKLTCFGVLFTLINLISLAIGFKLVDILRALAKLDAQGTNVISISQIPANDLYMIIALSIISFIIILFINGYEWDIVRFSIDKNENLPGFSNILKMFVNGVKYFIVTVAYNIIPIALLGIGMGFINESFGLILVLISIVLFIIAYFLLILAINNMVAHDNFKKAFDFKEIIGNISNLGWGKYVGILIFTFIVYLIIMIALGFVLAFITTFIMAINSQFIVVSVSLAVIEGLFISSYVGIFYNRVFGSIYRESIK